MDLSEEKKWLVIVNLRAGSKRCERDWPEIEELINKANLKTTVVFTERTHHAMELTQFNIEEHAFKDIIVVGGDGTMNEVANGIFRQKRFKTTDITIGLITVGTGNDWGRHYGMHDEYPKMIDAIKTGKTFVQDAGKVNYSHLKDKEDRYFVNIAGMGYDALVAKKTNVSKQSGKGGALVYLINLVHGLFQYKNTHLSITSDGKELFDGKVFSMSIGICKYNGGGMMQLPFAISDDGLFDITIIKNTTKFRVMKNIKNLYDGSFINMKEVDTYTGKEFIIKSTPSNSLFLETDGESLGHSPLFFEIVPKSVKLIVRAKFLQD